MSYAIRCATYATKYAPEFSFCVDAANSGDEKLMIDAREKAVSALATITDGLKYTAICLLANSCKKDKVASEYYALDVMKELIAMEE